MSANTMSRADRRDGLLRFAMCADAVISGSFGVAGLTGWIAEFIGAPEVFEYGAPAFFVGYGVIVLGLARLPSVRRAGMGVVVANTLYAVGAAALVLADVFPFTAAGTSFTMATAAYTLLFATLQYFGGRRSTTPIRQTGLVRGGSSCL